MPACSLRARAVFVAFLTMSACGRTPRDGGLDPANELPFGYVDAPRDGAQIVGDLTAGGWAMDDQGIREVRLYVDGLFTRLTRLNTDRPDVQRVYPKYAHGSSRHGWTVSFGFESRGAHTIVVQAVDTAGATRDIGVIQVVSK